MNTTTAPEFDAAAVAAATAALVARLPARERNTQRRRDSHSHDEGDRYLGNKELRYLSEFAGLPIREGDWPAYDDHVRHALLEALMASNARYAAFMLATLVIAQHSRANQASPRHERAQVDGA